jgi:oligoendopeptidase F
MSRRAAVVIAVILLVLPAAAQRRDRASIPEKYKWDLTHIYPSDAAWRAAKDTLQGEISSVRGFKGTLGRSPAALADALERISDLRKTLYRISTYANLQADEDTRQAERQGMRQEVTLLASSFGTEVAFIEPELLQIGPDKLRQFVSSESRLASHRFYVEEILRTAAHTLSEAEEKILATAAPVTAAPSTTSGLLLNAEFPFPTIALSDGRAVKVDQQTFAELRQSNNRGDREKAMSAYFGAFGNFSQTFGATLSGSVRASQFYATVRKYDSDLAARLDSSNIPVPVYARLIEGVNRNLPAFHRYLKLRKRMLGVSELHYYDLYAPLVGSVNLEYTPEEAHRHIAAAVAPLGTDYVSTIHRAFNERWIDLMPNDGKRSGAYATGAAYDVHPYVLLNHNDDFPSLSTVAHEWGHAVHTLLANANQPYEKASYSSFIAESASIANELLLGDYLVRISKTREQKLFYLGEQLELIRTTFFRQAMFAEFQLAMHEIREQGHALSGAVLTFFGFMHGESVGFAVTPTVAIAYAIVAAFLFGLSRSPATWTAPQPSEEKAIAATPAE